MRVRLFPCAFILLLCCFSAVSIRAREVDGTPLGLETFNEVWQTINDTHFDTNFNGHNWNDVREKYRPRAAAAKNPPAFREVIQEMLDLLSVSHLAIVSGDVMSELEESGDEKESAQSLEPADTDDSGTLGMEFRYVQNDLLVTRVEPGLPAASAGVKPGWIIKRIGTAETSNLKQKVPEKFDDRRRDFVAWRAASKKISGAPGSSVELEFVDERNRSIIRKLSRTVAQGEPIQFSTLPVLYAHLDEKTVRTPASKSAPKGLEVGLIRFNIWMLPTAIAFNKAIDQHRDKAGMILDLRGNVGGMVGMIIGTAGHFTTERIKLGTMLARDNTLMLPANPRLVDTKGNRVKPFAGPVAILVDEITASASEVFAGGLQENGRVRIFGRTTSGQALPAVYSKLPNGDALYHPVADFVTSSGKRFEGRGVIPDEPVELNRADFLAGRDPDLARALQWIASAQ
ncbi:MAG TPA: S41 family peptidase [Candidatus Kapabacteria bacterium]|nr:S41 family peptidase [Candidatus Kapabacteria bacterium]